MKRYIHSLIATFFCMLAVVAFMPNASGKVITVVEAETVAVNFFKQNAHTPVTAVALVYTEASSSGDAVYFAFNINPDKTGTSSGKGFVIIVADDALYPVIGYSIEGSYMVPSSSSNAGFWMEQRKNEIITSRINNVQPTQEITSQWNTYINGNAIQQRTTSVVLPLVQTTWDQQNYYDALCPHNCPTGCEATAMAQIMRFWQYPPKGIGSNSYTCTYYSQVLSADFGTTTYNWSNMPLSVASANTDVATLMYQIGVSLDMQYTPSESSAAGTTYDNYQACSQISYSKYFGYNPATIQPLQRTYYTDQDWINFIETELNAGRPVHYEGMDNTYGGHAWVCDGYDANNNLHMNWGWSGGDDGYYSVDALTPAGSPAYNFSQGLNEIIVGIKPMVLNDAGILSVTSPGGTTCNTTITPVVQIQDFGAYDLTSCTINFYIDNEPHQTYSWTGALTTGQSASVTLPATSVTSGAHTFTSYTSNPNNTTDGNTANDKSTNSFTIALIALPLPMSEGFEGSTNLPTGWSTWDSQSGASWQVVTTVANSGANCIGMNNCNGDGNYNMTGSKQRVMTMPYSFSNETNINLSFAVAYAPCSLAGTIFRDTLAVYYSLDCGSTWTQCYIKGGAALATAPTFVSNGNDCWSPDSASQWRTDNISLNSLSGQSSVMLAFENRSDWGEWIYLDNINLSGTTGIASITSDESFSIYPNPARNQFTVGVYPALWGSLQFTGGRTTIELYNVLGKKVFSRQLEKVNSKQETVIDVSDLAKGMYLLKVSDSGHSRTAKIDVR